MARTTKKQQFVLSEPPEDLGNKVYSFGRTAKNGKTKDPTKTGERKKPWRSPAGIYMLALGAFLIFWFFYSLIATLINNSGGWFVLLEFGTGFMALVTCLVIIICSVFGLWGKFVRFALNHRMVKSAEVENVEQSAEMVEEAYEKAQMPPPIFEVYDDYIRATDNGEIKVINRAGLQKVKAYERSGGCYIAVISDGVICAYDFVWLHGPQLPMREVKKLKEVFGDKLEIEPLISGEDKKRARRERVSFGTFNVAPFCAGLLCAAVGGGVIAMHFYLAESIPIFLGVFFMAGGALFMFASFEGVPIIKVFVIPLIAGCVFAVIPIALTIAIASANGMSIGFTSVHQFLCSFNGLLCGVAFLEAMGVLILVVSFYNLYKYIRYGEQ